MEKHPKPGYLFFTPRAPNGKRLSHLRFRHHLRASEDKVPDPASPAMQGLGGQMAPNQAGSTAQAGGNHDQRWNTPRAVSRDYPQTLYPAPRPLPGVSSPGVAQYQSSQDQDELDRKLGKAKHGFEGEAEGSKVGAERTDLDVNVGKKFPAEAEPTEQDKYYFVENRNGPEEKRQKALKQAYEARHTVNTGTSAFPGYQPPPPQPIHLPVQIPGTFTPQSSSKPVPDSALRPTREWLNKSGEPPDALHYSPFVTPSRPFVQRNR